MMLDKAKLSKKPNFDNGLYTKSALPALIFSWVLCNIYSAKLDYPWNYGVITQPSYIMAFFLNEKVFFTNKR